MMSHADHRCPSTIPPPPVVATCGCGATYTEAEWSQLTRRRLWRLDPDGETVEIAECTAIRADGHQCGSTMAVPK